MILFFSLFFVCTAIIYWYYRSLKITYIKERLSFGFSEQLAESDNDDLTAGDYGLVGRDKFYFYLQNFFQSLQGRIFLLGSGAAVSFLVTILFELSLKQTIIIAVASGLMTLLVAMSLLLSRRKIRAHLIKIELPNALEIISALMEGGLAFEASLSHVLGGADTKHPLYFDLEIISEAMRRGRRRSEALKLWSQRCNLSFVTDVTSSLIQAEQTSASLGAALRHQAVALQRENESEIQRRAEKLPVKMLLPMILTILPSVIVVAALPSMLKIVRVIEQIMQNNP